LIAEKESFLLRRKRMKRKERSRFGNAKKEKEAA